MTRKRTIYTAEFKAKLVLETLRGDKSVNEVAVANGILTKNLQNWRATFLANAEMALEPMRTAKEYAAELKLREQKINKLEKALEREAQEKEWLAEKVKTLGFEKKKTFIEPKLATISVLRQSELIGCNRSSLYYQPRDEQGKQSGQGGGELVTPTEPTDSCAEDSV